MTTAAFLRGIEPDESKQPDTHHREKQQDRKRYGRYLLTGEAIPQAKVIAWMQGLAQGQVTPRPQ